MSVQAGPAPSPPGLRGRALALRLPQIESDWVYGGLLGAILAWIAIRANGGLRVGDTTVVEIVLDLLAGAIGAVALLAAPRLPRRGPGTTAGAVFALFVVMTMLSTVWSVLPDQSWIEANRVITYLGVFGIGLALVRLAPHRWTALLTGVTLASIVVSAYALAHKAFPGTLEPNEIYARLRQPFGYWNAVGLMAALGIPGCLWLGARRAGHQAVNALAYPATGLLVVVMLLSYSRGSLLAAILGAGFWFAVVPLRLRGIAVLAAGAAGGAGVIAWAFAREALTQDDVALTLREQAGHELALAVGFMMVALLAVGLAVGFIRSRSAPAGHQRRRAGVAVAVAVALIPVGGAIALAATDRGLGGSISHGWSQLTDPNASSPTNEPGRLTGVASVRARYWNEALKIFRDHPWIGVGVGGYQVARLRYRNDNLDVQHAHGYVVQVLADRGIVGIVLSLAALAALALAVGQATGLRRGGATMRTTPERVALMTLASMLLVFGVSSFVDWTWFIPGVTIPVLLAGGWLAGRGPLEPGPRPPRRLLARVRAGLGERLRVQAALAAVVIAVAAAWAAWQPQRSIDAGNAALDAATASPPNIPKARKLASTAHERDPLSVDPYLVQAAVETKAGNDKLARGALEQAVRLQPANPKTWVALASFQLDRLHDAKLAKRTLQPALYLDPRSREAIAVLLRANRDLTATS